MKRLATRTWSWLFVGLLSLVPVAVIAAPDALTLASSVPTAGATEPANLLFILRAAHGVITHDNKGYKLTLTGLDDQVLFFTDRPVREAGQVSLSRFVSSWGTGTPSFAANPPNVILLHKILPANHTGFSNGMALIISNPIATANSLTFDVKSISGAVKVGQYDKIAIFIDAWQYKLPHIKKFGAPTIT